MFLIVFKIVKNDDTNMKTVWNIADKMRSGASYAEMKKLTVAKREATVGTFCGKGEKKSGGSGREAKR